MSVHTGITRRDKGLVNVTLQYFEQAPGRGIVPQLGIAGLLSNGTLSVG